MTDFIEFLPLFQETVASIRARLDADLNAGLAPDDERRVDTRPGGFYYDVTQPVLLELARLWDVLSTEVPAAASPATAWGEYLDEHAAVFGLTRKAAVKATGTVQFAGAPGTLVAAGTRVSAEAVDPDIEPPEFATTISGTTGAQLAPPDPTLTPSASGGTLESGTYFYAVTAVNAYGETQALEESVVVVGPSGSVGITWLAIAGATGYHVYRGSTADTLRLLAVLGDVQTYTDTGSGTPSGGLAPTVNTTAGVTLPVEAVDAGAGGNVATGAITELITAIAGIETVYNPAPTTGGVEPEDDEGLRARVLISYEGSGAGTVGDYRRWALDYPGVGRAFVEPLWNGAGTVKVVVLTADGQAVPAAVVSGLQADLDPVPGLGEGRAPIGAVVTVTTPTRVAVPVNATVTFEAGFSLDGTGGTIATRPAIVAALSDYIDHLEVGEDVVRNHVEAQFFRVRGVRDVSLTDPAANVVISTDQIAYLGTVTLG